MPEQNDKNSEASVKDTPPTPAEKAIIDSVTKLSEATTQLHADQAQTAAILKDPDVQKLLAMKAEGKEFTIGEPEAKVDPLAELLGPLDEGDPDPEAELSGKDVLKHIGESLPALIASEISKATVPLMEQIAGLKNSAAEDRVAAQETDLNDQVSSLLKSHSDAPDYQEDMVKLAAQMPTISVEQAYLLAKTERHGNPQGASGAERPAGIFETLATERANRSSGSNRSIEEIMQPKGNKAETNFANKLDLVLTNRFG